MYSTVPTIAPATVWLMVTVGRLSAMTVGAAGAEGARRSRDAKVHDQRLAVGIDHDVGGFEIAMNDAGGMCGREARGHRPRDFQRAGEPAVFFSRFRMRAQVLALDKRHRDVLDAVDLPRS